MKRKTLTADQVRARLVAAVDACGSQAAFARQHGISPAHVNDVLHGRRGMTAAFLDVVGVRLETTYIEKGQ
jgi:plasmid maintenance system antidote protein VapI